MSQQLFDSIILLESTVHSNNIHKIREELVTIVTQGKKNSKLRIITQFLKMLEILATVYEYEEGDQIQIIKHLIQQSLETITQMVQGKIDDATDKIDNLMVNIFALIRHKIKTEPFIFTPVLMEQLASDIHEDIDHVRKILYKASNHPSYDYQSVCYYLKRLYRLMYFIGMKDIGALIYENLIVIKHRYQDNQWTTLGLNKTLMESFDFLINFAVFLENNYQNFEVIKQYLQTNSCHSMISDLKNNVQSTVKEPMISVDLLSSEEIDALLADDTEYEHNVSFEDKFIEEPVSQSTPQKNTKKEGDIQIKTQSLARIEFQQEDLLVELSAKLFLKQEQMKISFDKYSVSSDDFLEIETLSQKIKDIIFGQYYISLYDLLGQDIRNYIRDEVKALDKKIRLGIRGEHSEILSREADFIKNIIFEIVAYSLHHSLEMPNRRKAYDKNETGWLLLEFEDSSKEFRISIRDDGRGFGENTELFARLDKEISAKGGVLSIDSAEQEYLKVTIILPMKKIMVKSLVIKLGDIEVLLPTRCVEQILSPKEAVLMGQTDHCIGQISLFSVLGLEKSPVRSFILCSFSDEKVLFGVEEVLYEFEALIEEVDVPMIACSETVVITRRGSVGFLLNEKNLYTESKRMIKKRTEALTALI